MIDFRRLKSFIDTIDAALAGAISRALAVPKSSVRDVVKGLTRVAAGIAHAREETPASGHLKKGPNRTPAKEGDTDPKPANRTVEKEAA